jgi:hypothetical protein
MTMLIAMPAPPLPPDGPASGATLPELPGLTQLLWAAHRGEDARDWRAGVLKRLDVPGEPWPSVAVAAQCLPDSVDAPLCGVTALHVVPGISRVHLPAEGLLVLDDDERDAWRIAFNAEFGTADTALHAVPGGWLLAAPFASQARDAEPESLLDLPLQRVAAVDVHERTLRRLGAETEMWLSSHALNKARESRRQLPINCLWFSGGTLLRSLPPVVRAPGAVLAPAQPDPWTAGLARHCRVVCESTAGGWAAAMRNAGTLVIAAARVAPDALQQWMALEAQWFEPAWQAWQRGELTALQLQIGRSAWLLPRHAPLRWLRRRRAWWQAGLH